MLEIRYKYYQFQFLSKGYFRIGQNTTSYQLLNSDFRWEDDVVILDFYMDREEDYIEITDRATIEKLASYEVLERRR